MTIFSRIARNLASVATLGLLLSSPTAVQAQDAAAASAAKQSVPTAPQPRYLKPDDPWIYRKTDIPVDKEWLFGEMPNGLRYAVRRNGVPPGQVSIRIRIDAGSLYEKADERGYAHLIEHLTFRQSKYLESGAAIPTWQRLGATFGSDTNAETTPTQTVYKLDLPNATPDHLAESMKLLSGMIREPALSQANLNADLPIVLAERRENAGPNMRVAEATRSVLFDGQPLSDRSPIGTVKTLKAATPQKVRAFHDRWYRPENTVIVAVGDADPKLLAKLIEDRFADWKGKGKPQPQPDFGTPKAPADGKDPNPVGKTDILVEPSLPRGITYAILRPWEQVNDNIEYNRGLLIDAIAQAIINRRLEARARAGGSYLFAGVEQQDVSRSADATFVTVTPLGDDWKAALDDVRSVIADALAEPPTKEEIQREVDEYRVVFANQVEQRDLQAGAQLADTIVNAVDIREAVAAPEVVQQVFTGMQDRLTPEAVFESTKRLFSGTVTRALMLTPKAQEATAEDLRSAMKEKVEASGDSRIAAQTISFADLPPIGTPQQPEIRAPMGVFNIEGVKFPNGVTGMVWRTTNEPGRVTVRVRFGSGYRAFTAKDAPYIPLGEMALVGSGLGDLGEEELDRISTGRKLGFDFRIEDGTFVLEGRTRPQDVADQLYLFAAKLAMPRWNPNPVNRAKAAISMQYNGFDANPTGIINRDLEWLLHDKDPRFATPTPEQIDQTTPEGFRKVWEPLLKQGPVEVMVFGDIDPDQTVAALSRTFGALDPRDPIPAAAEQRTTSFPASNDKPLVITHQGEADQAAAVMAWPTGGGSAGLPESRKLEVLSQLFSNRLLDAVREGTGSSYAPSVSSNWPLDTDSGGYILAMAQLPPEAVPVFFIEAQKIAEDLAANGPDADELARVTEPFRQLLMRVQTGHAFWMDELEGATRDPNRLSNLNSMMTDYTKVTPEEIKALAAKYLTSHGGWRLAIMPEKRSQ
ncbi:insulinase family protein [Altericroceibacterium spongiae]|uniref:Insulinase family protein n=1 Tax=Altericroceibacterium spongiae TaxID=2320269 RepID=A0A420EN56_9SPHN|nr:insulinase family protein [Altericroceibacterium spongiae]RKF22036.1 insulinase family protein [Altericroceibacterium spongiae]